MTFPENIIIFDMEVTKFNLDKNVLVQFSARKYLKNDLVSKLNILINNPETKLETTFLNRTRLSKKKLIADGITYEKAVKAISDFIGKEAIITYKGNFYYFDMLFFILGKELINERFDIIDLISETNKIDNPDNISLKDMARMNDIEFDENRWHNSNYDVSIIEKIWFKLKTISKKEK
ncbi:MAG: hypothetical protein ACRC4M_00935 [Mycoplasma sp.]